MFISSFCLKSLIWVLVSFPSLLVPCLFLFISLCVAFTFSSNLWPYSTISVSILITSVLNSASDRLAISSSFSCIFTLLGEWAGLILPVSVWWAFRRSVASCHYTCSLHLCLDVFLHMCQAVWKFLVVELWSLWIWAFCILRKFAQFLYLLEISVPKARNPSHTISLPLVSFDWPLATTLLTSISKILSFQQCYISGVITVVPFGDWFSSVSIIRWRAIPVAVSVNSSFLFIAEWHSIAWMYHSLFKQFTPGRTSEFFSNFWLLRIQLLRTFLYKLLGGH